MVATNPFLIDTLSDPVYVTFFHPWVIYPSLHFDIQFCCFFYLTEMCWQSQPPLTAFVFSENIYFILSLILSLHRISPIYSKWKMTKNNFILFPPSSFGWCPLPWLPPPFLCPSYRVFLPWLTSVSSPISPSLPSCSCPLPPSLFLFVSHSYAVFSSHNKGMFFSSCLKPILDLICPSNCSSSPFHL